jgi:glycosyltransferase involved in cell wall biosynthesis
MKIAFVNQPIDTILPPYQTSVGACTWGVANSIARSCEVVVYGSRDCNRDGGERFINRNVEYRFLPSTRSDRLINRIRQTGSKLGRIASPASTSSLHFRGFGRNVALELKKAQCDVIHLQHCSAYLPIIREFNPSARIVLHLHAEWFSQNNFSLLQRRLRYADLVTTVSGYVTQKVRRAFPTIADRCETTYNGIDADEFSRERNYAAARKKKDKVILYAGAVSPHKGIHVLIDAFRVVAERCPDVRLKIIGFQGSYSPDETFDLREDKALVASLARYYRDFASRLKSRLSLAPAGSGTYLSQLQKQLTPEIAAKIEFPGLIPRPELIENYYAADVFAFAPVWNEGFGIPPVEAMAAGVPVVASRSGAVTETVQDSETGYLVDKNNPQQLATALLAILGDDALAERMGRAGRRRVMERFTWDRIAQAMFKRYQGLCGIDARKQDARAPSFHG